MMDYFKYFITPVLIFSVILGILLGGNWMFLGLASIFVVMIFGDLMLGEDHSKPEYSYSFLLELPLHMAVPSTIILLLIFAWSSGSENEDFLNFGKYLTIFFEYDFLEERNKNDLVDYLGAMLGVGYMIAGYATNVGHELIHRIRDKIALIEGRWLLSASCNSDFSIEHIYNHHLNVGTEKDPATAKRGENVYVFFVRSTVMGHLSAWNLEMKNLRSKGTGFLSIKNKMITGYLMSAFWCILFFIAGGYTGLILFLGQALFAKFVLEIVNYMEHYGLTRKPEQRVGPEHSWNSNKRMSGMVLFSLTRHSAHHEKPRIKYWKLDPYIEAPQMPFGYLTTTLICLIPPLWYKIMAPRLAEWDIKYNN